MTYDESNSKITEFLTGRTIEHVIRNGKVLEFHCSCGHIVKLQADLNHDIHFVGQSVHVVLPKISMEAIAGSL